MASNAQAIKNLLRTNLLYARNAPPERQNAEAHEALEKAVVELCDAMASLQQELAEIKRMTGRQRTTTGQFPLPPG